MDMTAMLFDNAIYGLTKKQTSPTTPVGFKTNTHPDGAWLPPLDPLTTTLGMTNVSFVAQTVDWNPVHLHATLLAAYRHKGFSFVRILQRCPTYTDDVYCELQQDPGRMLLLTHPDGVPLDDAIRRVYKNEAEHDPSNKAGALALASQQDPLPLGLLYRNPDAQRYDEYTARGLEMPDEERLEVLARELDQFAI
jgi:2-oxoglutarate ferredoxin oxidoreductase subunit beta